MSETDNALSEPPRLVLLPSGGIEKTSLADVIEWFLNYDERTARIRHPQTEQLFRWKQDDDAKNGIGVYPFENAESRFAVGVASAIDENSSEPLLALWLRDVLAALQDAKQTTAELTTAYKLDDDPQAFAIKKAEKLNNYAERRIFLTSCWLDALLTAEARVLGWIYQQLYGRPFSQ